ncbi:MAG: preprotein translocase subunit SecG [Acidobacteriia bacterium]|nr:preprotein translocase subunit SecG [Terriglobia bacterium]
MYYLVLAVHIVVCFFLIIVILLQSGKAADLAGAFGGMGSQTAFGPRGSATLLSKATTISAVIFMVTSMTLSIMATRSAGLGASVLEENSKSAPAKSAPAPAPAPAQTAPAIPGGKTVPLVIPPNPNSAPAQSSTPASAPAAPVKK